MKTSIKRALFSASALALGFAAQTASASAITIHPMTFDECGTNSNAWYNCMYINGSGLYASEVRGWAESTSDNQGGSMLMHIQITYPGGTYCNGITVDVTAKDQVVNCQKTPDADIPAGQYCSIVWYYDSGTYVEMAKNCGTVSA